MYQLPTKNKYSKLDDLNYYYFVLFEVLKFKNKPLFNDRTAHGVRCSFRFDNDTKKEIDEILSKNNIPHKFVSQNRLVIETHFVKDLYKKS